MSNTPDYCVRIEAPHKASASDVIDTSNGWAVVWVHGGPTDIQYQKFTKNYRDYSERPWVVTRTRRGYKTLEAALRAYGLLTPLDETKMPTEADYMAALGPCGK
jgi:hypothetical protein